MDELSTQVNLNIADDIEALSLDAAAERMGITYNSITRLLRNYPDIKDKYTFKRKLSTQKHAKPRTFITTKGMVVLANVKDKDRGNQYKVNNARRNLSQSKQQLAERAIEQSQLSPAQALLQAVQLMAAQEEKLQLVENKVSQLEEKITSPKSGPIEKEQRDVLWDRVNALAYKSKRKQGVIWKELHDYMKRDKVADYTFADYRPAAKWLQARIDAY